MSYNDQIWSGDSSWRPPDNQMLKMGLFKIQDEDEWWSRLIILIDVERMNVWLRISGILSTKLSEFILFDFDTPRNCLNLSLIWCVHYYYASCIAQETIVSKPNNLKPPDFITSVNKLCRSFGLYFSTSFLLDIPPKLNPIISLCSS